MSRQTRVALFVAGLAAIVLDIAAAHRTWSVE